MKKLSTLLTFVCLFANIGSAQTCPNVNHVPYTDFNPSPKPGKATTLWVSIHTKLNASGSGSLTNNNDYIIFKSGTITLNHITSSPAVSGTPIPAGIIIASSSVSSPVTSYDAVDNTWITKVPPGYSSSDIFITGAAIISSTGFAIKGPSKQSAISGRWQSNLGGQFASSWFYCEACYQPTFTCSNVANAVATIASGIRAGTPTNQEVNLVAGGSGGGGSDYTGSNSSTDAMTSCKTPALGAIASTNQTTTASGIVQNNIKLTVSGGTGIYTYLWNNGATTQNLSNVPPGTYTVIITDLNGNTTTVTIKVAVILPIQLVSFDVQEQVSGVLFKWHTAIELDNKYFVVERSYDCISFDSIASLPGNGTTNMPHDYSLLDEQIPQETTYYRLRQVNEDGSLSYSAVKVIQVHSENSSYMVYPNPVTNYLIVENHSQILSGLYLDIYNLSGENIFYAYLPGNTESQKISLPALPNGYYTVIIKDANGSSQSFKIMAAQ